MQRNTYKYNLNIGKHIYKTSTLNYTKESLQRLSVQGFKHDITNYILKGWLIKYMWHGRHESYTKLLQNDGQLQLSWWVSAVISKVQWYGVIIYICWTCNQRNMIYMVVVLATSVQVNVWIHYLSSIKLIKFSHRTDFSFYYSFTIIATTFSHKDLSLENIS